MSMGEYLASKSVTLCFLGIGGLLLGTVAAVTGTGIAALGVFAGLYVLVILLWLAVSFLVARLRLQKLEKLAAELPEKYLLGEVLPEPADAVERRYFQVLREISRSAVGVVEEARREKEEYCDYVEQWIHEIKTPLTACTLILANGGDARKLKPELKRADNLTESILYYARMRTAEKDTQIRRFQGAEVIEEAVKSQMELLIAAKVRVEVRGDLTIYSDKKAVCFILKQLLINSAKYCPGCRVVITAGDGTVTVEDDGIGIPAHELRRVTERGFTGTNGRQREDSTGMGLYIVRELCKRLEIGLGIESRQGEYTRTTLTFGNLTKL